MASVHQCASCGVFKGLSKKNRPDAQRFHWHAPLGRIQKCGQCGAWVCKRCAKRIREEAGVADGGGMVACSVECMESQSVRRRFQGIGYERCANCGGEDLEHSLSYGRGPLSRDSKFCEKCYLKPCARTGHV